MFDHYADPVTEEVTAAQESLENQREEPCDHRHQEEQFAGPTRKDGTGPVLLVCADCDEILRRVGWSSVF